MQPIDGDKFKETLIAVRTTASKHGYDYDVEVINQIIALLDNCLTIEANPINSKLTNRERFMRELSNEDLAKILKDASGGNCPCQYCIETQDTCKLKPCIEGVIEWLESPSNKCETESE